jgi:anaerobic selenocysteine-containing dehydrogenase
LALGIAGEMIRNNWFDVDFVRDWTNGPLLVRTDTQRFLRAGELANPPIDAQPEDLLAWDDAQNDFVPYSIRQRTYARACKQELDPSIEHILTTGETIRCRSAFGLYRDLCDAYPPDRVEQLTWIEARQVTETAELLYASRPVSYYAWSGVGQHTNATQTDRAISLLMTLTGSFDAPGGNVEFARPAARDVKGAALMSSEQRAKCVELKRSPLGPGTDSWVGSDALYDAILQGNPYPIRGVVNFGRNFLVNHADSERGARALSNLRFFVHCDVMMTPTASLADIFLPVNTPWEREALRVGFEGSQAAASLVQFRQAVTQSAGESQSDAFIVFELAKRLGFGDLFWDGDVDAGLNYILAPLNLTLETLRKKPNGISIQGTPHYFQYRQAGFKTHTGKIEIFSEVFRDAGEHPLPIFIEPAMSPYRTDSREFPLVLTSAKVVHYCHGQHRSVPSLRRRAADPEVSLHPETASERGIQESDWVEILTPKAKVRMKARLDASLHPRVVCAQYGWWQDNEALGLSGYDALADTGANYNRLIDDDRADPISGSTGLRSSLCDIRRIETLISA